MKKLRLVLRVLAVILCFCCLTGCMGNLSSVTINKDGSGTINAKVGLTEEGIEMLNSMSSEPVNIMELDYFNHNGFKYYGEIENYDFSSVEELTAILNGEILNDTSAGSFLRVGRLTDDGFELEITLIPEDMENTQVTDLIQETTPEEQAAMDELMKSLAVVFDFTFPYPITQTDGVKNGIIISGTHLTFDMIKVSEAIENTEKAIIFKFVSVPNGVEIPTAITPAVSTNPETGRIVFTDVFEDAWYYAAVDTLANGGLIQGMGDGIFSPDGTLTYAQFCQILAKAKGEITGTFADYWAYNAIKSCINAGYVTDIGVIAPENYDIPIPREAAIAAMYRAKAHTLTNVVNTNPSVPDIEECEYYYKDDVLKAYKFGITKGVDEIGTFLPKKSLTRAEVCQLFYNLNWSSAER